MKRLEVAAGIILNSAGRVLLAQRPEGKHLAGLWEFPGGKIEPGESGVEALRRELKEELELQITEEQFLDHFEFPYEWGVVRLHVFVVKASSEPKVSRDVPVFRWVEADQIETDQLAPADVAPLAVFLASR